MTQQSRIEQPSNVYRSGFTYIDKKNGDFLPHFFEQADKITVNKKWRFIREIVTRMGRCGATNRRDASPSLGFAIKLKCLVIR
jgi:hypothetical protein